MRGDIASSGQRFAGAALGTGAAGGEMHCGFMQPQSYSLDGHTLESGPPEPETGSEAGNGSRRILC